MINEYKVRLKRFKKQSRQIKKLLQTIGKMRSAEVDLLFHDLHEVVFSETNCLECANCCSTTSPIFRSLDIDRLGRGLHLSPRIFIQQYLVTDPSDGHFMLKTTPCPFLREENCCKVYENRPEACSGFPHTNRRNIKPILPLIWKNAEICPAVAEIFLRLLGAEMVK